jgi:tRNA(Ile)-lysidine synthase
MKYVVAVSGGVDSVVLLAMMKNIEHTVIVAHFDHGIRPDSAADARFVEALASSYGLAFETERSELGSGASEDTARTYRYAFLRRVAAKHDAVIITAHHRDDVIETVAINLIRGTGWRGLAVMNDSSIHRPLMQYQKKDIYAYALAHGLEWVEDSTNGTDRYLRNRLRRRITSLSSEAKAELMRLHANQRAVASEIQSESVRLMRPSRYMLTMIDEPCATELLRSWLNAQSLSLTRPQLSRLLHAIKTARPGDMFQAGNQANIVFSKREFIVKHPL